MMRSLSFGYEENLGGYLHSSNKEIEDEFISFSLE